MGVYSVIAQGGQQRDPFGFLNSAIGVGRQATSLQQQQQALKASQFEYQQARQQLGYSALMPLLGKQNVTWDDINGAVGATARLGGDPSGIMQNATEAMSKNMLPGDFVRQYSQMALPPGQQWEAAYTQGGFSPQQLWEPFTFWDGQRMQHVPMWRAMGMTPPGAPYQGYGYGQRPPAAGDGGAGAGAGFATRPGPRPTLSPPPGVTPDEDAMVRTIIGEAADQPLEGQQGVAHVIMNRVNASKQSPSDVVFAQGQFEPWGNPATAQHLAGIDPSSDQYQNILTNVVRPVETGNAADNTGGATHFFAPALQQQLGRNVPAWATPDAHTVSIGGHSFYRPAGGFQIASAGPSFPVPAGGAGAAPQLPPAFGWSSAPPGYETTVQQAIGRQNELQAQLQQVPQQRALLDTMENDLDRFTSTGPGNKTASTYRSLLVAAGLQSRTGEIAESQAASEQFNKVSQMLAAGNLAQMGTPSDLRTEMSREMNPGSALSYLGNKGIIHMLKGNVSATNAMGTAWQDALNSGQLTPGQFDQWRNQFNAVQPNGARFDPRVFWMANMSPDERETYLKNIRNPTEFDQLMKDIDLAQSQRWIFETQGGGWTSPY